MTTETDEAKKTAGQPTKYKEEYNQLAFDICKETGAIDIQLAKILKVSEATINNWKKDYPEFLESLKAGKEIFDTCMVEKSLLKSALGYDYEETTTKITKTSDGDRIEKAVHKKHMPGSVPAQSKWLDNRYSSRWRNTRYIVPGGNENENWGDIMKGFGEAIQGKFIDKPE